MIAEDIKWVTALQKEVYLKFKTIGTDKVRIRYIEKKNPTNLIIRNHEERIPRKLAKCLGMRNVESTSPGLYKKHE